MSDPKSNIPKFARDWPIHQKPGESTPQNRPGTQPNLNRSYNDAKPNDNRIGRVDSLGVRNYAEGEGLIGEPRAIVRFYKVDARGEVHGYDRAFDMEKMRQLQNNIRAEQADPTNRNPHTANNLHNMKELAYALDAAIETGIDLGYGITKDELLKLPAESVRAPAQAQIRLAQESSSAASKAEPLAAKAETSSFDRTDPAKPVTAQEAAQAAAEAARDAREAMRNAPATASAFKPLSLDM